MRKYNILLALAVAPAAFADVNYDEATVVDVEPIRERVEVIEPREQCWFETHHRRHRRAASPTAPLVGALIGGAVGNALGHKKRNKQVGAVAGALVGASIAHDISREARSTPVRSVRREVCEVVEKTTYRERVTGYMVTYRYRGQTHRARMDQHPGASIRIRVAVRPA